MAFSPQLTLTVTHLATRARREVRRGEGEEAGPAQDETSSWVQAAHDIYDDDDGDDDGGDADDDDDDDVRTYGGRRAQARRPGHFQIVDPVGLGI